MLRVWAALAMLLTAPAAALAQSGGAAPAPNPSAAASSEPDPAGVSDLTRVRRGLEAPSVIRDAVTTPDPANATFRTRVDGRYFDIWGFWGEPDTAVSPAVRPWVGGNWHHEFQDMVTPDEFKAFGMLGTSERLQLAATQVAFAAAMALAKAGFGQIREAARERERARAKEEVRAALEAFFREHPEARPAAPPSVPVP
jgi:hypothetical protein